MSSGRLRHSPYYTVALAVVALLLAALVFVEITRF